MLEIEDEIRAEDAPRLLRDKGIKHYRLFPFELRKVTEKRKAADGTDTGEEEELYEFSICSDAGVEAFDWWTGETFLEVLSHEKGALVSDYLDAGASVLLNHKVGQLLGRTSKWWIDGKKGERKTWARMKWSPLDAPQSWGSPQGVKAEVDAGVRGFTSIGFEILAWEKTKKGDLEKGERDEYTATKWRIFEWSFVDIPADITVGRSRARFRGLAGYDDGRPVTEDERKMDPITTPAATGGVAAPPAVTVDQSKAERDRASAIITLGRVHQMQAEAEAALCEGTSVDTFRALVLEKIATRGTPQSPAEMNPVRGMSLKDRSRYSYRRALLQCLEAREGTGKLEGVEAEVHEEIRKNLPAGAKSRGGVYLPMRLFEPEELIQKRAFPLDSTTSTEGAEFKFTQPMEFIEMLRTRLAVARLGARVLTGLVGPLAFPRQTAAGTASWIAEEASVSDSMAAFDTVTLAPKTLMSSSGYTRQLLEQTSYDIEGIVRDDLAQIHARAIDSAAIQGTGASNQPRGVANQSGVLVRDCGAGAGADAVPDLTDLVSMIGLVADANADYGALGFLTTPLLAATLSRTLVAASAGSEMLWMGRLDEGTVRGYRAIATNQVTKVWNNGATTGGAEHGLLYGNWNELMIGLWNAMEAIVDPYSQKKAARIEITTFQLADIAVRHPVSFCIGTNAIP